MKKSVRVNLWTVGCHDDPAAFTVPAERAAELPALLRDPHEVMVFPQPGGSESYVPVRNITQCTIGSPFTTGANKVELYQDPADGSLWLARADEDEGLMYPLNLDAVDPDVYSLGGLAYTWSEGADPVKYAGADAGADMCPGPVRRDTTGLVEIAVATMNHTAVRIGPGGRALATGGQARNFIGPENICRAQQQAQERPTTAG